MLGVPKKLIDDNGAVSETVALSMAECALLKSGAGIAFSITGLAGSAMDDNGFLIDINAQNDPPIGTVWVGLAYRNGFNPVANIPGDKVILESQSFYFTGLRNEIREAAAMGALEVVKKKLLEKTDTK